MLSIKLFYCTVYKYIIKIAILNCMFDVRKPWSCYRYFQLSFDDLMNFFSQLFQSSNMNKNSIPTATQLYCRWRTAAETRRPRDGSWAGCLAGRPAVLWVSAGRPHHVCCRVCPAIASSRRPDVDAAIMRTRASANDVCKSNKTRWRRHWSAPLQADAHMVA